MGQGIQFGRSKAEGEDVDHARRGTFMKHSTDRNGLQVVFTCFVLEMLDAQIFVPHMTESQIGNITMNESTFPAFNYVCSIISA